jgi:hypothetical protein
MGQARGGFVAIIMALFMLGCGGSEYRFGNSRTLPNLSGDWTFDATSTTTSQQFHGTASFAQTNNGVQGTVTNLFTFCASAATLGGVLNPVQPFDPTSVNSYKVDIVLQEKVPSGSAPQAIELLGSASADGKHMSGVYSAESGACTTGDSGTWVANKN